MSSSDKVNRALLSMVPGTMGGRMAQAQPVQTKSRQQDGIGETAEAIFSYPGEVTAGEESPPYLNRIPKADLDTIMAGTISTTSGPTVVEVMIQGVTVATVTIPAGARKTGETVVEDVPIEYGEQITVKATTVGGGLLGLVVQVLYGD
jgi:hypothetical protein